MVIPPNLAAAGVKTAGTVTSALIGRYRPAGVPRTGSSEDRAAAYQRLLDAVAHANGVLYMTRTVQNAVGPKKADEVLGPYMGRFMESGAEVIAALNGVKLRGTITVIAAAEALAAAESDLDMNEQDDATFNRQYRAVHEAQTAFLDAARTDLGYDTKWYQVRRRAAEKKFLQGTPEETPAVTA